MLGIIHPPSLNLFNYGDTLVSGAEVASRQFVEAMVRYMPPTAVALFADDEVLPSLQQNLRELAEARDGNHANTLLLRMGLLRQVLAVQPFTAFHFLIPCLDRLSYVRARFSPSVFPITSVSYGFGGSVSLWEFFARLALTPTLPCDAVICSSAASQQAFASSLEQVRAALGELGLRGLPDAPQMPILPLGIDAQAFRPRDKRDVRYLLNLPQDKTLLLSFGRLEHIGKADLGPLLLVLRELLQEYGETISLVLAGALDGNEKAYLERMIEGAGVTKHVYVRGNPTFSEAPLYYSAADIFVGLSDTVQESFGLAPLEAMASELPVVVADWSAYRETVIDAQTGYRVPTLWGRCEGDWSTMSPLNPWQSEARHTAEEVSVDVRELKHALGRLLNDPQQRQRMGAAARRHVEANYTWRVIVPRYQSLWEELAEVASTLQPDPRPSVPSMASRPFDTFGHYATHHVDESMRVTASQRDVTTLWPSLSQSSLSPQLLEQVMDRVRGKIVRLSDLQQNLAEAAGVVPEETLRSILWLFKFDFIKLV